MIVVVAKEPEPGFVKTRLCPPLTPAQASRLAERLLRETVETAVLAAGADQVALGISPPQSRVWFDRNFPGLRKFQQCAGDLGERMAGLCESAFFTGASPVILIGADLPGLEPSRLRAAEEALRNGPDLVLGPAVDGGYYLVGLTRAIPELFESITWSTPGVLQQTIARAEALRLSVTLLPTERDLDSPEDYAWWVARLKLSPGPE